MPVSKFSTFRTDGQPNAPRIGANTFVPFYAVLFWYGNDEEFINTSSGTLGRDYYRKYSEIYYPSATYYYPDGNIDMLRSNPIICCVNADANWADTTGLCVVPSTSLPNTAATLFSINTHNPTTLNRTRVYNTLAIASGDVQTSIVSATFIEQRGDHAHRHSTNNIADGLRSIVYGQPDRNTGDYTGINAIVVDPILRDPQLTVSTPGINDTRLRFFPKDIIVFGNNLPSEYYTREDIGHISSATGEILPIMAKGENVGVLGIENTLSFTLSSNAAPSHNHNTFPSTRRRKSNRTNQIAFRPVEAGVHTHKTTYSANVALRSKILKAWITKSDQTPISNGVIIAYSIGYNTLYPGPDSNSQTLPVNWHFCDGNNGTPDLRGYYIYANFNASNTYHNVVYNSSNTLLITSIDMEANGIHSHVGPETGQEVALGTPTDIGSHTSELSLNHTHDVSDDTSFKTLPTDTANVVNIKVGQSYSYTPPTVGLAFIMYNNTII
jgi:hypothetical protein